MKNKKLGKIHHSLDDCLQRIEKENARLEDCLNEHPEHKNELIELINIRNALQDLRHISPSDEFYRNSPKRITQALVDQPVTFGEYIRHIFIRKPSRSSRRFNIAQFVVTLILLITLATGGVYAADAAQPGDLLYGLGRAIDQVTLMLISKPESIASTRLMYAAERLDEAKNKIEDGELDNALIALEAYDHEINQLAKMITSAEGLDRDKLKTMLLEALNIHQETLTYLLELVPEEAQAAILNAITVSMPSIHVPLDLPKDSAPGAPADIPFIPPIDFSTEPPVEMPIFPPDHMPTLPIEDLPIGPPEGIPSHPREKTPPAPPLNNP